MKEAGFLPNVTLNVNIAAPVIEQQQQQQQEQEEEETAEMTEEEEGSDSVMEVHEDSDEEGLDEQDDIVRILDDVRIMQMC